MQENVSGVHPGLLCLQQGDNLSRWKQKPQLQPEELDWEPARTPPPFCASSFPYGPFVPATAPQAAALQVAVWTAPGSKKAPA